MSVGSMKLSITGLSCSICGKEGKTDNHFGALCCNSCGSFFRRTVRHGLKFVCDKASGACSVKYANGRKNCRKCRFDKCLQAGMNPNSVQHARDCELIKRRRQYDDNSNGHFDLSTSANCTTNDEQSQSDASSMETLTSIANDPGNSVHQHPRGRIAGTHNYVYPDPEDQAASHDHVYPDPRGHITPPICRLTTSDLLQAVPSALSFDHHITQQKCSDLSLYRHYHGIREDSQLSKAYVSELPDFSALPVSDYYYLLGISANALAKAATQDTLFCSLSLQDQASLIRGSSWITLLMDDTMRSKKWNNTYLFCDNAHAIKYNKEFSVNHLIFHEVIPCLRNLAPDSVQWSLLRSIAFWNVDVCSKECKTVVRCRQQLSIMALEQYIASKPAAVSGTMSNFLLLLLNYERFSTSLRNWLRSSLQSPDAFFKDVYLKDANGG